MALDMEVHQMFDRLLERWDPPAWLAYWTQYCYCPGCRKRFSFRAEAEASTLATLPGLSILEDCGRRKTDGRI